MTRTNAQLAVSPETFAEIWEKLDAAGYSHAITRDGDIDMNGIDLTIELPEKLRDPVTVLEAGRNILRRWGILNE